MFNSCSPNPFSSRTLFAAMGVARLMSTLGIRTYRVGQTLFGVSVLKIDLGGGSGV